MPIGSSFDDFLRQEGIFEATTDAAHKKILALPADTTQAPPVTDDPSSRLHLPEATPIIRKADSV